MSVVSEIERIKNEVTLQSAIIDEISSILDSKAGVDFKLQEKTVVSTTVQQEILPDEGYDGFSKIIVNAIPNGEEMQF